MMAALAILQAAVATIPPRAAREIPSTDFACRLERAGEAGFDVKGRVPALPAGRDRNMTLPMAFEVTGWDELRGGAVVDDLDDATHEFRDYQVMFNRKSANYVLSLKLRRGGAGVAWLTRYAPSNPPEPYRYVAAGLCTSDFDVAAKKEIAQ